jgi:hypothetical protein
MSDEIEYNYRMLYEAIDELLDAGEDADVLFDTLVCYFAEEAERHQKRARQFKSLLDHTRSNDPSESVPEATTPPETGSAYYQRPERPSWDVFGDISELSKDYLSSNANKFIDELRKRGYSEGDQK